MAELIEIAASWRSLLLVLVVFGFAPGFVLRLLVRIYPKDDPRRTELVSELYMLGRVERLLFVAEQLETVLFEGLPYRLKDVLDAVKRLNQSGQHRDLEQPQESVQPTTIHRTEVVLNGITHQARVSWWDKQAHLLCDETLAEGTYREKRVYGNVNCDDCNGKKL